MRWSVIVVGVAVSLVSIESAYAQEPEGTPPPPSPPTTTDEPPSSLDESLTEVAKSDYLAGVALFNDGDFAKALVKFKAAYEASKDERLLANVAACERALRREAEQPHQGRLSIVAKAGDAIAIDGKAVGIATYDATLKSGMHTVRVTAQGKKPHEQRVVIEDNQVRTLNVSLEKDSLVVPLWAMIGIGVAAVTGIIVVGYFALRSSDDEKAQNPVNGTMQPGLVQLPSFSFR